MHQPKPMHQQRPPARDGGVRVQADLRRLQHPHRPSTAPIGNERLMAALRTLANSHSQPLTARKLLARCGADSCVSTADDSATALAQWDTLLSYLKSPTAALIFHLENHYSLIYGARAWQALRTGGGAAAAAAAVARPGATVRQVLVGKPGQQPSRWIPWEDVRACLLQWKGYAVIVVQREMPEVASGGESERHGAPGDAGSAAGVAGDEQ